MTTPASPWREKRDGVSLRVRLTPRSSRDGVDGIGAAAEGPVIKARVRAVPEDCAANAALERLIADWLGVARSCVIVSSGHKSRVKVLDVTGEPGPLALRLAQLTAGAQAQ